MFKEVMANMNLQVLPSISLLLFFAVFIGTVVWSFRKKSSEIYTEVSNNALSDGSLKK